MLAAHRNGGRTDYASFARAWDEYTGAGKKSRRASRREVNALYGHLRASLERDGWTGLTANGERSLLAEVREVQVARRRLAEQEAHDTAEVTIEELLAQAELEDVLRPGTVGEPEEASAAEEPDEGDDGSSWESRRDAALAVIGDSSATPGHQARR